MTGPITFVGIAKVVVLVTSPFALLVTPGRTEAIGVGEISWEGDEVGIGIGVGVGFGEELAMLDGEVEGDADALGEGDVEAVVVSVDPPPPPPKPPPPPPPPKPPPPELPLEVADELGVGVGEVLGATVAIGAAVTFKLPDSVENGLIPTPLLEAILAV